MITAAIISLGVVSALLALGSVYLFGRKAQRRRGQPSFALAPESAQTQIDHLVGFADTEHPGETGLHLLADNLAAFRARWLSARLAGRSLDLQYYYWKDDMTGQLLLSEVVTAAGRGVRVRMLLDDINSFGFDPTYLALDSHPNIEVRLFNPSRSRTSALRRGLELIVKYFTATRRMHNKCWIADGRLVIAGGRNIGDAYFDAASTANFRDADILAVGEVARNAEDVFDAYWNSEAAIPIKFLHKIRRPKLSKLLQRLYDNRTRPAAQRFLELARCTLDASGAEADLATFYWAKDVELLADPPEKAAGQRRDQWLGRRLDSLARSASQSLRIISPYFIPGEAGAKTLLMLAARGVDIKVLTNSLAATDVIAVHGAYSRYRRILLKSALAIFELKPEPGRHRASLFGSKTASLHTKAFVVDHQIGFVGSFNLDPRSRSINTEMGILFRCPSLTSHLLAQFDHQTRPDNSYAVSLKGNLISWSDEREGKLRHHDREPDAPWRRLIPARIIALLPIESQL
jgi:cardiolipin synthase C